MFTVTVWTCLHLTGWEFARSECAGPLLVWEPLAQTSKITMHMMQYVIEMSGSLSTKPWDTWGRKVPQRQWGSKLRSNGSPTMISKLAFSSIRLHSFFSRLCPHAVWCSILLWRLRVARKSLIQRSVVDLDDRWVTPTDLYGPSNGNVG